MEGAEPSMLFAVTMHVELPPDLDPQARVDTIAREKAYSQDLQRAGKWPHIWRIVGQYSNLSIFDVETGGELHDILWNLPLFRFMKIQVTPLAEHPSDISAGPSASVIQLHRRTLALVVHGRIATTAHCAWP